MQVKRNYVFDLGQVLLIWNPYLLYDRCVESVKEREWLFTHIFDTTWRDRSDIYITVRDNVEILATRNPDHATLIRKWDTDFFTMMPGLIQENWRIVRELQRRGHKVFGLSNFAIDKYTAARARFPELGTLDDILVSAEAKFRKPERGIYKCACERFGIGASDTVFIDELDENVFAARAFGMTGITYTSHELLLSSIEALEGGFRI
jgi:2-haloacid dehalogenase